MEGEREEGNSSWECSHLPWEGSIQVNSTESQQQYEVKQVTVFTASRIESMAGLCVAAMADREFVSRD